MLKKKWHKFKITYNTQSVQYITVRINTRRIAEWLDWMVEDSATASENFLKINYSEIFLIYWHSLADPGAPEARGQRGQLPPLPSWHGGSTGAASALVIALLLYTLFLTFRRLNRGIRGQVPFYCFNSGESRSTQGGTITRGKKWKVPLLPLFLKFPSACVHACTVRTEYHFFFLNK